MEPPIRSTPVCLLCGAGEKNLLWLNTYQFIVLHQQSMDQKTISSVAHELSECISKHTEFDCDMCIENPKKRKRREETSLKPTIQPTAQKIKTGAVTSKPVKKKNKQRERDESQGVYDGDPDSWKDQKYCDELTSTKNLKRLEELLKRKRANPTSFGNIFRTWASDYRNKSVKTGKRHEGNGSKWFISKTAKTLFDRYIKNALPEDRNFYGLLHGLNCPNIDVDQYFKFKKEADEFEKEFAKMIVKGFQLVFQKYGIELNEYNVLLSTSSGYVSDGRYKLSWHAKVHQEGLYFENMFHQKLFWQKNKDILEKCGVVIDECIYKENGSLRLLYCEKYGTDRPLYPYNLILERIETNMDYQTFLDHMVTNVPGACSKNGLSPSLITPKLKEEIHDLDERTALKQSFGSVGSGQRVIRRLSKIHDGKFDSVTKLLKSVLNFDFGEVTKIKETEKGEYIITVDGSKCPHSHLEHHSNDDRNKSILFIGKNWSEVMNVRTHCFRKTCQQDEYRSNRMIVSFKVKGNKLIKHARWWSQEHKKFLVMDTGMNIEQTKHMKELGEILFPGTSHVNVQFPEDPLKRAKQNGYFGMKHETYEARHVKQAGFCTTRKTVCLKSPCDTGKSTMATREALLLQWIYEIEQQKLKQSGATSRSINDAKFSSLFGVSRQTLGHNMKKQLAQNFEIKEAVNQHGRLQKLKNVKIIHGSKLNAKMYLDHQETKRDWFGYESIIVSVDSLIYLTNNGELRTYKFVWLDEIESLIKYVTTSDTLNGKRKDVWNMLVHLVTYCEYLLVTDADMSDTTLEFISRLRDISTSYFVHNTMKTNEKSYQIVKDLNRSLNQIIDDAKDGKKLYLCTDSKKQAIIVRQALLEFLDASKILYYDSDTCPEDKNGIVSCDELWTNYQIVISSPVIVYGVDCNPKCPVTGNKLAHFDVVYGLFTGHSVDAQSAAQMLERIRKVSTDIVFIGVTPQLLSRRVVSNKFTLQHIEDLLEKKNERFIDIRKRNSLGFWNMNSNTLSWVSLENHKDRCVLDRDDHFNIAVRNVLYQKHLSDNNFLGWLCAYVCSSGGKIIMNDWSIEVDLENIKRVRSTKAQKQSRIDTGALKRATELDSVELVTGYVYEELKRIGRRNHEQQLKFDKFLIHTTYGVTPPDETKDVSMDDNEIVMDVNFLAEFGSREKQKQFLQFSQWARVSSEFEKEELAKLDKNMDILAPDSFVGMVDIIGRMMEAAEIQVGVDFEYKRGQVLTDKMQKFWDENKNSWVEYLGQNSATSAAKLSAPVYGRVLMDLLTRLFGDVLIKANDKRGVHKHRYVWNLSMYLRLLRLRMDFYGFSYPLKTWAQ
jgi:hypothetical protein